MVAIIDYGVGNLFSLKSSFSAIGADAVVTSSKSELERADSIILPGVGAFCDAAKKLRDSGLEDTVISLAKAGKPLMGICLGMQLLFEKSYEYGEHRGLGLIKGEIRPIETVIPMVSSRCISVIAFPSSSVIFTTGSSPSVRFVTME